MICAACGRQLTNEQDVPNTAHWTYAFDERQDRLPYCGDSAECMRDAEELAGVR